MGKSQNRHTAFCKGRGQPRNIAFSITVSSAGPNPVCSFGCRPWNVSGVSSHLPFSRSVLGSQYATIIRVCGFKLFLFLMGTHKFLYPPRTYKGKTYYNSKPREHTKVKRRKQTPSIVLPSTETAGWLPFLFGFPSAPVTFRNFNWDYIYFVSYSKN